MKVKKKKKRKEEDIEPPLKPDLLSPLSKAFTYYDSQPPRRETRDPWLRVLMPALLFQPQEQGWGEFFSHKLTCACRQRQC